MTGNRQPTRPETGQTTTDPQNSVVRYCFTDRKGIAKQCPEREVTSSSIGDAPVLPELLDQIPPNQEIRRSPPPLMHVSMHCRATDALCGIARPISHGLRLRTPGFRDPNPYRDPKWLHSAWRPKDRGRRLNLSRVRGSPNSTRFVQQSHFTMSLLMQAMS